MNDRYRRAVRELIAARDRAILKLKVQNECLKIKEVRRKFDIDLAILMRDHGVGK